MDVEGLGEDVLGRLMYVFELEASYVLPPSYAAIRGVHKMTISIVPYSFDGIGEICRHLYIFVSGYS